MLREETDGVEGDDKELLEWLGAAVGSKEGGGTAAAGSSLIYSVEIV